MVYPERSPSFWPALSHAHAKEEVRWPAEAQGRKLTPEEIERKVKETGPSVERRTVGQMNLGARGVGSALAGRAAGIDSIKS
jgi:hypothetical protein